MADMKQAIVACIDFMEEHLTDNITLDALSAHTGTSKYHLHRVFKALTGETLIDYMNARRLTRSINELVNTNMRMIDIAIEYGFDYEQSYIRAFKKMFGHTPLRVRKDHLPLVLKEKINRNDIFTIGNSLTYKPQFIWNPQFNLVGVKTKLMSKSGDKAANAAGQEFYFGKRLQVPNTVRSDDYYGYTDWSESDKGYVWYIPSVQVSSLSQVPEGMTGFTIPAHKYVTYRFIGFFHPSEISGRQVGRLLIQMYSRWISGSGYRFAAPFRFEYINGDVSNSEYCELAIYQPITDK